MNCTVYLYYFWTSTLYFFWGDSMVIGSCVLLQIKCGLFYGSDHQNLLPEYHLLVPT